MVEQRLCASSARCDYVDGDTDGVGGEQSGKSDVAESVIVTVLLIRQTAKELAGAWYEEQHSERFRKFWPDVKVFIARNWPTYIPLARQILVEMLRRKDSEVPASQKEQIYDALIEDRERSARQASAKVGRGPLILRPDEPGKREQAIFYRGK